jgi:uncharacterized membrane protein YoaK (UPF0700 family)
MGRVMSPDKAQWTSLSHHTNRNLFVASGHLALISKRQILSVGWPIALFVVVLLGSGVLLCLGRPRRIPVWLLACMINLLLMYFAIVSLHDNVRLVVLIPASILVVDLVTVYAGWCIILRDGYAPHS